MTEDRLNELFDLTRNQPGQIPEDEVGKWVTTALAGVGFLAGLKLLLTKKLIMIGTISTLFTGIAITTVAIFVENKEESPVKRTVTENISGFKNTEKPITAPVGDTTVEKQEHRLVASKELPSAFFPEIVPLGNRMTYPEIGRPVPAKIVADSEGEFTRIDASGFVRFKLVQGDVSKISLNFGSDKDPDMFEYKIKDNVLRIKGNEENQPEEIIITVKKLEKLELNGFCSVETSGTMNFNQVEIELDGFSKAIIMGDAEKLETELNGESKLEYTGTVEAVDIDINGMSGVIFKGNTESMELEINGNSSVSYTGDAQSADIEANGASEINYSGNTQKFELESNGESKIQLTGSSSTAEIELNGTGKLRGDDFKVQKLTIEMNGDCGGTVQVSDTLDVELSGMTNLTYTGSPKVVRQEVQKFCKLKQR